MQLGMIGLGRMGGNMVRRLQRAGHQCVAFARNPDSVKQVAREAGLKRDRLGGLKVKLIRRPRLSVDDLKCNNGRGRA